jgi:hypothetical protein
VNEDAKQLVSIDLELRFVLFGLQVALGVVFPTREMERVFSDALDDQASPKEYHFHDSARVSLTGSVDAYEPETIWLRLRHPDAPSLLLRITEAAHYEIVRIERANEQSRNVS